MFKCPFLVPSAPSEGNNLEFSVNKLQRFCDNSTKPTKFLPADVWKLKCDEMRWCVLSFRTCTEIEDSLGFNKTKLRLITALESTLIRVSSDVVFTSK